MRRLTEAEILQAAAVIVAAPRYMGAFASAIGIELVSWWWPFPYIEIGSGAAMAILEGWAIAFTFRRWRKMKIGGWHWYILLGLQVALMVALPLTAAPYLVSSQLKQPVYQLMPVPLLWGWSLLVAGIAPLVLAAVGYADREPARVSTVSKKASTMPALPKTMPALPEVMPLVCEECGASAGKSGKPILTIAALNAHKRFCAGPGNGKEK